MASEKSLVPLQEYIAERIGVLTDHQIAQYFEELSKNELVLESVSIGADREVSMSLPPQEQVDQAHIASGHAVNFLRNNKLPDKGLQDLQAAQQLFVVTKLNFKKKPSS